MYFIIDKVHMEDTSRVQDYYPKPFEKTCEWFIRMFPGTRLCPNATRLNTAGVSRKLL